MSAFFVWLSGADRNLLDGCTGLRRSERTRFAGIGALVLVPGVLGMASMTYAISTVSSDPRVFVAGGLAWAAFVVAIDRYLVSTLHTSSVPSGRSRALSIVARLVFSVFVGVAVSHPLVMLWFDKSISQVLADREQAALEVVRDDAKAEAEEVGGPSASAAELADAKDRRECLVQLQTAERAGQAMSLPCGVSSPMATCGPRCVAIGDEIAKVDADIAALRARADGELAAAQQQRERIDTLAASEAGRLEQSFSRDYLARVNALGELESRDPHVRTVTTFMIIFFILVDILPMTLKMATPAGEYEELRDTALLTAKVRNRSEREVLVASEGSDELIATRARHRAMREEMAALGDINLAAMASYTDQRVAFDRHAAGVSRGARSESPARRMAVIEHLQGMRSNFDVAWSTAIARLREFLETPARRPET